MRPESVAMTGQSRQKVVYYNHLATKAYFGKIQTTAISGFKTDPTMVRMKQNNIRMVTTSEKNKSKLYENLVAG